MKTKNHIHKQLQLFDIDEYFIPKLLTCQKCKFCIKEKRISHWFISNGTQSFNNVIWLCKNKKQIKKAAKKFAVDFSSGYKITDYNVLQCKNFKYDNGINDL